MFAQGIKLLNRQRPLTWTLLIAVLLHLLFFLYFITPHPLPQTPKEVEKLYSQATQVALYDTPEPEISEVEPVEVKIPDASPEKPLDKQPVIEEKTDPVEEEEPETEAVEPEAVIEKPAKPKLSQSLIARSLEIARLETQLDSMQSSYTQQPRVRRISSGATMTSEEKLYLQQWEQKVERTGNLNYPEAARRNNLGGKLRLLVVIAADGRILEAQLLTSSGHQILDDAALRILNLAAPFAPLPEAMKKQADVLEIIRTWRFGDGWYAN